jgi:signal transduction histidine kinase
MNWKSGSTSPLALLLMGLGTLALIAIILTSSWLASTTADLSAKVVQARQTRIAASEVLETLLNAETGQRGYLLTGNARYLAPFAAGTATINRDLDNLDVLERDNADVRADLARLRILSSEKMDELGETVRLAQQGQRDQALALVRTNRGITVMDESRRLLQAIITDSERIVSDNLAALNANARLLRLVSLVGGALVMVFAGAALWVVLRAVRDAMRARVEVEQLNATLEDRVASRTSALQRANEEIQRFAYIVSHDLRAPLVNIMGFTSELDVGAQALATYFETDAEAAKPAAKEAALAALPEAVKFIRSSTGKMDRLINAILKLSREGRRELIGEPVDLRQIFETITGSLKHQIDETGTVVHIPPRLPPLTSDRLAVEQIFSNLIDNALKYLQPGRPGEITITAETKGKTITIIVADNGRGIGEQDLERVFELFRRAGRQDRPGEGIGLANVRALVRRLGGDITLRSRLGEGSQFCVQLPRFLSSQTSSTLS